MWKHIQAHHTVSFDCALLNLPARPSTMAALFYWKLASSAYAPEYVRQDDPGPILRCPYTIVVAPAAHVNVDLEISVAPPDGTYSCVQSVSRTSEQGVYVVHQTISSGHRDPIIIQLYNSSTQALLLEPGSPVAQLIIEKCTLVQPIEVGKLPEPTLSADSASSIETVPWLRTESPSGSEDEQFRLVPTRPRVRRRVRLALHTSPEPASPAPEVVEAVIPPQATAAIMEPPQGPATSPSPGFRPTTPLSPPPPLVQETKFPDDPRFPPIPLFPPIQPYPVHWVLANGGPGGGKTTWPRHIAAFGLFENVYFLQIPETVSLYLGMLGKDCRHAAFFSENIAFQAQVLQLQWVMYTKAHALAESVRWQAQVVVVANRGPFSIYGFDTPKNCEEACRVAGVELDRAGLTFKGLPQFKRLLHFQSTAVFDDESFAPYFQNSPENDTYRLQSTIEAAAVASVFPGATRSCPASTQCGSGFAKP